MRVLNGTILTQHFIIESLPTEYKGTKLGKRLAVRFAHRYSPNMLRYQVADDMILPEFGQM